MATTLLGPLAPAARYRLAPQAIIRAGECRRHRFSSEAVVPE